MLHVPFEQPDDFVFADVVPKVLTTDQHFGNALCCNHPIARQMFTNAHNIEVKMKLEADNRSHIASVLARFEANTKMMW